MFLLLSIIFLCLGILILFHHFFKHSDKDDTANFLGDTRDQWFQCSDLRTLNFQSHEIYVYIFLTLAMVCFLAFLAYLMSDEC